jgi:transposase-like protein
MVEGKMKLKGYEMRKTRLLKRNIIQQVHVDTLQCKFCNSLSVVRYGLTEKGKQRFLCQKCKRTFVGIDTPERAHYSHDVIASAINQFYEAASLHKIKRQIELDYHVSPSHMTIYRWIARYSKKATKLFDNLPVESRGKWVRMSGSGM